MAECPVQRVIVWRRLDTHGLEYAEVRLEPLRLEGQLVLIEDGKPCAVSYRVDCDDAANTVQAVVHMKLGGVLRECMLERSSEGRWKVNGSEAPQLDGLADVDLSVTPSTNTAPIRRLRLGVGQRAEVIAAWVKFPSLDVVPLRQSYRRVGMQVYEYESADLGFAAELECDDQGIVRRYGGLWTRVP
jgi:hypothetical protein